MTRNRPEKETGVRRVTRAAAAVVGVAWVVLSVTHGGLQASLRGLRASSPGPGQPDARKQWSGPYFDALDELARRVKAGDTVAVVLTSADRPGVPRMLEAVYRLYPVRPDFYLAGGVPAPAPFSFGSPAEQIPVAPPPAAHRYILWGAGVCDKSPAHHHRLFRNAEAEIYREAD